mmetsp:Transcript_66521/g.124072  ORF Transcript_66521/g.124072 Transcript_66521/m.124072 type:complete len:521 (+) Transcript_66521:87-1649(+)
MAGRKVFVGSLPHNITDEALRDEFNKYGNVEEVFVKPGCEPGRQWAFVTFATPEQAQFAKEQCDRILQFPGTARPCDVMVAKNQGMFGQQSNAADGPPAYPTAVASNAPKKIFVGSLPDGIGDAALRDEFSKYGIVTDVFLKEGCESGKQWAFISFSDSSEAELAAQAANGTLLFVGARRPCEVTLARNQGLNGVAPLNGGSVLPTAQVNHDAPRKCFVGSLPDGITEAMLRAEFDKFGQIIDVFIKPNCESGRQWAFITFANHEQAQSAKTACDCILQFPGSPRPCEVTLARNQGMFGQDPINAAAPAAVVDGPKKIFVGSLPDNIAESTLRAEFDKYGQVVDVFVKPHCEPGRQWAFVTFVSHEQAVFAKESTDRVLTFPGAARSCEVMLAKNQGKFGQEPLTGQAAAPAAGLPLAGVAGHGMVVTPPSYFPGQYIPGQPPPPSSPPPPELTPWRMYQTAAGLPYYHNSVTGVTQWQCPPELQMPSRPVPTASPQVMQSVRPSQHMQAAYAGVRFSPY